MKWLPLLTGFALLVGGCASQSNDQSMAMADQINCDTAAGDLRVLRSEQAHAQSLIQTGDVSPVTPSGLVGEPEFTDTRLGAGEYSEYLGNRIGEIEEACPDAK